MKVNQGEFSKRMGISKTTTWRWLKAGLIWLEPDGSIDLEVARDRVERKRKGSVFCKSLNTWITPPRGTEW